MVYLATSQEWQTQTSKLLQARPATTRITTKYNIPNLESERYQKKLNKKRKRDAGEEKNEGGAEAAAKAPLATLELKTYDPVSGVVLRFKTSRAADVGRLITGLGRVGRHMAALPVKEDAQDVAMEDAAMGSEQVVDTSATETKNATPTAASNDAKPQQAGGGGGNKKKKKNKK